MPLRGSIVKVNLTDGSIRDIDLTSFLQNPGPLFQEVKRSQKLFRQVKVENGTLTWPNGLDLCPDVLLRTDIFLQSRQVLARYLKHAVPSICQFDGASIYVYPDDHPPPHIHVIKADKKALVDILTGEIIKGDLPPSLKKAVKKWLTDQRSAILEAYVQAQAGRIPEKVSPPRRPKKS